MRELFRLQHRDDASAAAGLEVDRARARGEDRVVLPDPHTVARLELGAALANDDLAARHGLPGEHLHAEALGVRVAPVAAGAQSLLVCHVCRLLPDLRDAQPGELLPVARAAFVAAAALELEDPQTRAALV